MRQDMQIVADRWMLESRRIVNWGSYDGYHEFRPSTADANPVTLLTGASESGKSTLVDAQISLLYPTGTPFNKASNTGRSERNDYTYLRGMLGVSDGGDADRPIYLRGRAADGSPQAVWGAIVDTYVNRNGGERLSCGKFLYCAAGDARNDLRRQYVVSSEPIDPRLMDAHRDTPFTAAQIRATYPGCLTFPNAEAFHAHIWRIMGLSAEACRMLHRIQSSDAPSRLDDIFKQGVLGVPEALTLARAAVDDYERYDENFHSIEDKMRRMALLRDVKDAYGRYERADDDAGAWARVDPDSETGLAAIREWTRRRMAGEVRERIPVDERDRDEHARELELARREAKELQDRIDEIGVRMRGLDGGDLHRLETELDQAKDAAAEAQALRGRLGDRFRAAGLDMPQDGESWDRTRRELAGSEERYADEMERLEHERDGVIGERGRIEDRLASLRRDRDRQRSRRTRITQSMDESRALLAKAVGLPAEELPYVAELMDVREEDEQWRTAMNVAYGQIARTILVDRRHEEGFAAKVSGIDPSLMPRRTWTFVDTGTAGFEDADAVDVGDGHEADEDGGWLSDRLRYREDSPFRDWVRTRTRSARFDARCVEAIDDANRDERQVQRDGQIKSSDRGYHGTKGMHAIIGFVNESYLDQLQRRIDEVEDGLHEADGRYRDVRERIGALRARHELADRLAYTTWDKVDEDGARRRVAELAERIDERREDPEMSRLAEQRDRLVRRRDEASRRVTRVESDLDATDAALEAARRWMESHGAGPDGDKTGDAGLSEEIVGTMAEAYERGLSGVLRSEDRAHVIVGVGGTGETFGVRLVAGIADDVRGRIASLRRGADEARASVELRMASYRERYAPDDDALTDDIGDYRFYLDELNGLEALAATDATDGEYANCLDKLLMDFTQLNRAIDTDARDIDDQLERINAMLVGQRFGPRHGSLSLHADVRRPDPTFTGQLRRVMNRLEARRRGADETDGAGDDGDVRRLFASCAPMIERLRQELDQVRDANGIRSYGARNLDPRCRSSFHAIVHHEDGPDERISSTGGRSGGALQELTSFVYGAALIYLLGGGMSGQPTYATLFLDEALIKADGRYTQRALSVLPRLGFQVIVSAPESKTAEILGVADRAYVAYRDLDTGRSYLQEASLETADDAAA
ncbi:ATP-binding protein [Bifidobacterium simiarum]|uniref:P-loop containing region of AAA domain-containing protein n=1 Tax=Bifidobacterium simiarum TaxID=2045441 RepID=A0A2M9HDU4_9BIFI|nr:ATP-binding protein [Bifidobacterium simiarum]PJM74976.1 hypothetical protein CSQ87_07030 [Bifidobacterium simiarum]